MEINIEKEHENKLFERREITAHATYDSKTPTRESVKEALCKKKSMNPEMVEIISIDQAYGSKECTISAYEYLTKEAKERGAFRIGSKQKKTDAAAPAAEAAKPAEHAKKAEEKEEKQEKAEKQEKHVKEEKAVEKPAEKKEEKQ